MKCLETVCVCSGPSVMRGVTVKYALTSTSSPPNDILSIPWSHSGDRMSRFKIRVSIEASSRMEQLVVFC
jgi:hypothetical protein